MQAKELNQQNIESNSDTRYVVVSERHAPNHRAGYTSNITYVAKVRKDQIHLDANGYPIKSGSSTFRVD